AMLARIIPLIRCCHRDMPRYLRGPILIFWVFHVIRTYAHAIRAGKARRENADRLVGLVQAAEDLEARVGSIDIVFGHNDLLAANFIDAGDRLWLIDWDYAGFNSPLFDLGGLASNNELDASTERGLIESYFERPIVPDLFRRYLAMKCASLLREAMWSMV